MAANEKISLQPKLGFMADQTAASRHSDYMASPAFKVAAASALLEMQLRLANAEPTVAAVSTFKLRGAQDFLHILMNLGIPEAKGTQRGPGGLRPPEEIPTDLDPV